MSPKEGRVYIVGAGPGDEGLITLRGLECIKESDVIIYDELANTSLLENAKPGAELIYAGKKSGNHTYDQTTIQKMLIEYAGKGKIVCRLKGGDPYVFGRGGDEAMALSEERVPYEVVPGVTSAISVPAYAGISVTQRGLSSGVAIFTGHEDPKKEKSDLNWKSIARLKSTLVFLMGMKNLPGIVDQLIRNGMDSKTPVAVIYRGTTAAQRSVRGELSNIVQIVNNSGLEAPSIIVVGRVVEMMNDAKWFEDKPLFGRTIVVTRPKKQAAGVVRSLRRHGAFVYEYPTIEIEPNQEVADQLESEIKSLSKYDWVIFTSVNGVGVFFDKVSELGFDSRIFGGVRVCTIGTATSNKLAEYSIKADLVPENGSACKRINLFLKWMIRKDDVDPGCWSKIPASKLIVPLDTHMYKIGKAFSFTARKQANLKTAEEISSAFAKICPEDPTKYDFALTRFGIRGDMKMRDLLTS